MGQQVPHVRFEDPRKSMLFRDNSEAPYTGIWRKVLYYKGKDVFLVIEIRYLITRIGTCLKLFLYLLEALDGVFDIFHSVGCGRYNAEHDDTFRHDRVDDHGTEYAIVLPQVLNQMSCLGYSALEVDRCDRRLSFTDVEARLPEAALQCPC